MKLELMLKKSTESRILVKQRSPFVFALLFLIIFTGGTIAFIFSMMKMVNNSKKEELIQLIQLERVNLETSMNGEITIAVKMASSPLIKQYFQNPADPVLKAFAFEEIASYRKAFAGNTVFWVNDIDLLFYTDDLAPYQLDAHDPANYWYFMTLHETETYNLNINYNPDLNVTNLWVNAPVFNDNGNPVGMVGTGMDITSFVDMIYRNYSGNDTLYFFNEAGEITGAKNTQLVTGKVTIDNELTGSGASIIDWIQNHSSNAPRTFNDPDGEIAVVPVPSLGWYIAAFHKNSLVDYFNTSMIVILFAMIGFVIALFVILKLNIRIEEKNNKIVDFRNALLKAMAEMLDRRDGITGGHIERTQRGIEILVEEIQKKGVYQEETKNWNIDLLVQSSQLHDIGKISISDDILKNPNKLSDEEYREMQRHAAFGEQIIKKIEPMANESDFLEYAKIFAASHHEKWDGSGYPLGLKEKEIPLLGRIMAIADVYDALVSERSYKKALTHEEAVKIIVADSEKHFDPVLVKLFLEVADKFKVDSSHSQCC